MEVTKFTGLFGSGYVMVVGNHQFKIANLNQSKPQLQWELSLAQFSPSLLSNIYCLLSLICNLHIIYHILNLFIYYLSFIIYHISFIINIFYFLLIYHLLSIDINIICSVVVQDSTRHPHQ